MNKTLKYSLLGIAGVGAVALAGAGYLLATFNPNDYKPQIIQAVKDSTQRTLRLDGEISLSFFPNIGANLGKVALSEYQSEQTFLAVDSARVSLALMPLFSKRVVVNEVAVNGLQASLIRHRDGTLNIDDLLASKKQPDENKSPVNFDVASIALENARLVYRDEGSGAQYTLADLNLHSGRIASGVPTEIVLDTKIQAAQPALDANLNLKTGLSFDPDKSHYQLDGLALQTRGSMAQQSFDVGLEVASLQLDQKIFSGEGFALTLNFAQPAQTFKLTLRSPLKGDLQSQQFSLPKLALALQATGDKLPNKSISSEMQGSAQIDLTKQQAQLQLAGGLLQSQVKAKAAVANFSSPAINFDIDVDQFDADPYLPPKDEKTAQSGVEEPIDLSALRNLNLNGNLRVGAFKVANVKSKDVRIGLKAQRGVVDIAPLSANLYEGRTSGSISIDARATPVIGVKQNLNGINVAALTKDAADFDTLEGKGNVVINLGMRGDRVSTMKKSLNGTLALNLADGAIRGINIAKKLRDAKSMIGQGAQTQTANQDEKTDFSELKANFKVTNGVAHNDDLLLKSPLLRLTGNGDIDIGNDRMNYLAKATLAKTLEGQGGQDAVGGLTVPVRISGPFGDLKYTLDFAAMASEQTKQKVEQKKEEIKTRLQDQIKGLFR